MKLFSEWIAEKFDEAARRKKSRRLKKRAPIADVSMDSWLKAVQALAKDLEEFKKVKKISDQKAKELAQKAKKQKSSEKPIFGKPEKLDDKSTRPDISAKPQKSQDKTTKIAPDVEKVSLKSQKTSNKKIKSGKKADKPLKLKDKKIQTSRPIIKRGRRGDMKNG